MAQVASELISITNNQKLADSKYIQDEALGNKKQSDINKDSLAGGVYNVTKLRPLQSGYYTITTAIAAVPQALRCVGMVITYQTASDSWETKQFKGILSDWTDSSKWEDFGGVEAGDGVYDLSVENSTEDNPIHYSSIQDALDSFTDISKQKPGMTIKFIKGDGDDAKYVQYRHIKTVFSLEESDWVNEYEDIINMINSIQVGGLALSDDLGQSMNVGITQRKITEVVNELRENNSRSCISYKQSQSLTDTQKITALNNMSGESQRSIKNIKYLEPSETDGESGLYILHANDLGKGLDDNSAEPQMKQLLLSNFAHK